VLENGWSCLPASPLSSRDSEAGMSKFPGFSHVLLDSCLKGYKVPVCLLPFQLNAVCVW